MTDRQLWAAIIAILLGLGLVGTMDYEDARRTECSQQNLHYNSQKDACE